MAKKTSSFHLEEDIYKIIEDYQKENNLSSRNSALERIILEYKYLIKKDINNSFNSKEKVEKVEEEETITNKNENKTEENKVKETKEVVEEVKEEVVEVQEEKVENVDGAVEEVVEEVATDEVQEEKVEEVVTREPEQNKTDSSNVKSLLSKNKNLISSTLGNIK